MKQHVGRELGPSDWLLVTQHQIDVFAELTQDRHWIHIDQDRARSELPQGKTVAHGLLTLSLMPRLADTLLTVRRYRRGLNYGCNKVRFTAPVHPGSRIRLRQTIRQVVDIEGGVRLILHNVLETDSNHERPAIVAETVIQMYD
ncbi:enoyl-CoA hydratase [Microvirga sp. KLBC 81]|uniref:MaoC family dehydratase n=1 Tax=Microvirga sp. KLBC 81 TaxID=1862707 RepID=UPI000D50B842|nr:MaoC family dehydratase [Microvirga sp. KLBC 81]PVE22298.1 enoyl-CoA hydratase [Microvirga sp. KLBC 81]